MSAYGEGPEGKEARRDISSRNRRRAPQPRLCSFRCRSYRALKEPSCPGLSWASTCSFVRRRKLAGSESKPALPFKHVAEGRVRAAEDEPDAVAFLEPVTAGERRGDDRGGRGLDQEALAAQEVEELGDGLAVGDDHHLLKEAFCRGERAIGDEGGAQGAGEGARLDRHRFVFGQRPRHRLGALGLDAVDTDRRVTALERSGNAGAEAAAADRE